MIKFENVSFSYGDKQVLQNFSLTINDGDRICFKGKSGAGKTTLIKLILNLEKPKNNFIECTDKKFSVVFQEDRLVPFKTVYENILLFGNAENCDYVLSSLGIIDAKNKYPSELSGGMARRVSIARALCYKSDVYIFDEPFTGLDKSNCQKAINLINSVTKGKTLIVVTHENEYAKLLNCKEINI